VEALNGPQDFIAANNKAFKERRDLVVAMLNQATGLSCASPEGAFYVYPSCGHHWQARAVGRGHPERRGFRHRTAGRRGRGGRAWRGLRLSPFFRVSYATATDVLAEACRRIQRFCNALD
jgi:aspartate aminotransferase